MCIRLAGVKVRDFRARADELFLKSDKKLRQALNEMRANFSAKGAIGNSRMPVVAIEIYGGRGG